MCNKEHLVAYLYDELSSGDRATFEAHVRDCAECREELDSFRQTRQHLSSWSPPEPALNVSVLRTEPPARPSRRWRPFVPQWALAAAATLVVLAGAAAIANLEVRYERDGSLVVRTGWAPRPAEAESAGMPPDRAAQAAGATSASEQVQAEMVALQARFRTLEESFKRLQAGEQSRAAVVRRPGVSAVDLRKVLAESEARQRTELAARIAQLWRDLHIARASDFARFQQTFSQVQGATNRQLQQQRESIDSLRYMQTVLHQNQK